MTSDLNFPKVEGGRVEPGAIQTIVMLQVAQRLRRIGDSLEAQVAKNRSIEDELTITDAEFAYYPGSPHAVDSEAHPGLQPLFGVTIRNDGPSNVYLAVNSRLVYPLTTPLRPNDVFNQNGTRANITVVYFRCLPGTTATLRLWGYY